MGTNRRSLLGAAAILAMSRPARTRQAPEAIALWPSSPPGGPGPRGADARPRLLLHRPSRPNGAAAIVIAGGGYAHIETDRESTPASLWLQSSGITAFELIYRLPGQGWPPGAPFQDAQRAMRIVRARAAGWAIDPGRIGMIGFSAGGHLAGMTATKSARRLYPAVDDADAAPARPDFCGLIYPVLSMMPPFDHTHARREIIGAHPDKAESEACSVERQVDAHAPPMFLAQAADDPVSPDDNSLMMFAALRAAGVAAELHLFQSGGHGWGMGRRGTEVHAWPALFIGWARRNAFLPS